MAESCDSCFHWGHRSIKTQKVLAVLSKRRSEPRLHILSLTLKSEGEISEKKCTSPIKKKKSVKAFNLLGKKQELKPFILKEKR